MATSASAADTSVTRPGGTGGVTLFQFPLSASNTRYTQRVSWTVTPTGTSPASPPDFAGNAYSAGTLYFYPGDGARTIDVSVLGTARVQDETFLVSIIYFTPPPAPGFHSSAVQLSRVGTIQPGAALPNDAPANTQDAYSQPGDLVLRGASLDYRFARTADGVVVQDSVAGRDGTQVAGMGRILFKDGVGVADPAGTAADVTRLYAAGLGRRPTPADLALWTRAADAGGFSMADIAHSIAGSPEFIQDWGGKSDADVVTGLYYAALSRTLDAAGATLWTAMLQATGDRGAVLQGLANSPEGQAALGGVAGSTNGAEAYRLYAAAFGRNPSGAEVLLRASQLGSGATPLGLARDFAASTEWAIRTAGLDDMGFVTGLYANTLHRAPAGAEAQVWTNALRGGADRAGLLVSMADSTEARLVTSVQTHEGWVSLG
jgi:Domain of unknown function (DUF4214)